jgi:3-dehydroquinate dehydratase
MMMSRESRKIIDELNRLANNDNVQGITTPGHICICDKLIMRFYTTPIINTLKSRISHTKSREWKHFTIDYWEHAITNMLSNSSAQRSDANDIQIYDCDTNSFAAIVNFLISDYSIADAHIINTVAHDYTYMQIIDAIDIARKANIYEIRYISAVLEKEKARQYVKDSQIMQLGAKIEKSDTVLDKQVVTHTPLEIASAQYNWKRKQEDAEIERKFNEEFGI